MLAFNRQEITQESLFGFFFDVCLLLAFSFLGLVMQKSATTAVSTQPEI